jgi:CubicO group peptidase (beta-lactamase class C family)
MRKGEPMRKQVSVFLSIARASWLLTVAMGFVATLAAGQAPLKSDARFEPARTTIRQVMEEKNIPSVSVAVAKNGKIIWEEAFGWADREKMIRATPDTLYSLASISKPFTATGLMRLVEQGKIDLDKPANEYLGAAKLTGLAGDASAATVRRVLSHTAGLPYHYHFFYNNETEPVPSMDESIAHYGIIVTPPGEAYEYSNLGYGIIDYIISRVSGRDYANYMRTEVFLPLGLTHTSVDVGPGLEADVAQRYDMQQRPIPFYTFDHRGGSAIYSSAHDLLRFAMFHLKGHLTDQQSILKDSTLDQMHETATPPVPADPGLGYGLGWITQADDHGYRMVYHTGGMPGVATAVAMYPSEDVAIVMLSNYYAGLTPKMMQAIAGCILPKYAETARKNEEKAVHAPELFTPVPELMGEWTGTVRTWEKKIPFTLVFQPDGDIHVKFGQELESLVNDASFRNGIFEGRFAGTMPTADAMRHEHGLLMQLRLRGDKLAGQVIAETPDESPHFALSSYTELTRKVKDK